MNDDAFEFNVDTTLTTFRQCYYCEKLFNRVDKCKFHQKLFRKRKYPNITSSNKTRKTQTCRGSQHVAPQLMTSALDGRLKTFRKLFDYDESAIDHMVALEEMIRDFIQLIKSESEQQDIKCFFSLPAVTLRSFNYLRQTSNKK